MDYALAIRRNRDQLKAIVLALFALARKCVGGSVLALPKSTAAAILMVLRPAESALRRLIVIAAHGLKSNPITQKIWVGLPYPLCGAIGGGGVTELRVRAFKLFDPLKAFDPETVWDIEPVWESGFGIHFKDETHNATNDDTSVDATQLRQRLHALLSALENIPYQAHRLKRWQARREAALKAHKPTRLSPMRPGLPPGWRQRRIHEIDDVLKECHGLANDLMSAPDTG